MADESEKKLLPPGFTDRPGFRVLVCAAMMLLLLLLLMLRLWQVQVLQGGELLKRARRQMIRPVRVNAVRGRIYAANGELLLDNAPKYDLVFYVSEMRRPGRRQKSIDYILSTEQNLANYLGRPSMLTPEQVRRQLEKTPVLPLTVFRNLTSAEVAAFSEHLPALPGVDIHCRIERRQTNPGVLSHVLGYAGWRQPAGDDILEDLPRLYTTPELTGQSGLEAAFDKELSGEPGSRMIMVDSIGYAREVFGSGAEPQPGNDLVLTIDPKAQRILDNLLKGYAGAAVLLDVNSGAVLAMASAPTYDINTLSSTRLVELMKDRTNLPLLNRATRGVYTPGSIVKPLMALAGLECQNEEAHQLHDCTGRYLIGRHPIRCAKRIGHGPIDLQRAIQVSCNPFFIHLALQVGIDEYSRFLGAAGLGEKSGIEIGDAPGILPSRDFARRRWKRNWLAVDTAYASIGQGAISITPLQAALFTAAIANDGVVYRPYLVREIRDHNGTVIQRTAPSPRHRLPASPENLALIREAMTAAVSGEEASAAGLASIGIPMAAKTGTAEVGSGENRHKNTWVVAFGPTDKPQYAFACIIEKGQSGGRTAVPIAAEFFKQWLSAAEE